MLARVQSFVLTGIDAAACEVEVDVVEAGLPREQIVGLPDAAVRESLERVRSAISNAGYAFPNGRILINLAPAETRKEGPVYDLPIAVGLLLSTGALRPEQGDGGAPDPRSYLLAGEVALDGRLRAVKGALAMALLAKSRGMRGVIVPRDNAPEAAVVEDVEVIGARTLAEVVGVFSGQLEAEPHPPVEVEPLLERAEPEVDFAEVRGQESVKRAIAVAAAGSHNLLMLGPAGTGKTMMAKALPGVLPPLTADEALEVTRIYSAAGLLKPPSQGGVGLVTTRPVRSPHHSASVSALIGGGKIPKPGEVTLAHRGVMFLDELPEFPRDGLESLRQPLEDGCVTIARAHSTVRFPAHLMLVAAMNPTAKGTLPADEAGRREMQRYLSRISAPLIDRIDIHVEAPAVPWKHLSDTQRRGTGSSQMREQVLAARDRQRTRQGAAPNARLRGKDLDRFAALSEEARTLLGQAMRELGLSARAYDKIRRIARTVADIDGVESLEPAHVAEAVQYRLLDRQV